MQKENFVVNLKPGKKMKKRKELDALVRKRGSGHELLQNEETDTDIDEFDLASHHRFSKSTHVSCCRRCWLGSCFVLLVACMSLSGGLLYLHTQLKEQLDTLQGRMLKVEQSSSNELTDSSKISTQLNQFKQQLQEQDTKFTNLQSQVQTLESTVQSLQQTAPQSSSTGAEKLTKDVADLGSELNDLKSRVSKVEDGLKELQQSQEEIQALVVRSTESPGGREQGVPKGQSTTLAPNLSLELAQLKQQVQELEARQTQTPAPAPEFSSSAREKLDMLSREVQAVNRSLWQQQGQEQPELVLLKQQLLDLNASFHSFESAMNSHEVLRNMTGDIMAMEEGVTKALELSLSSLMIPYQNVLPTVQNLNSTVKGLWEKWTQSQNQLTQLDSRVQGLASLLEHTVSSQAPLIGRPDGHLPPGITRRPNPPSASVNSGIVNTPSPERSSNRPAADFGNQPTPASQSLPGVDGAVNQPTPAAIENEGKDAPSPLPAGPVGTPASSPLKSTNDIQKEAENTEAQQRNTNGLSHGPEGNPSIP